MGVALYQILPLLDKLAPASWACSWDRVGLQLGDANAAISKILVCLDVSPDVVDEAKRCNAQLLISHHPLFFDPIGKLDFTSPLGGLIKSLVTFELNVYVAHTNLDIAPGGVCDTLAEHIGLLNTTVLQPEPEELNKVVVFVPKDDAVLVYEAMVEAGAGQIGSYSGCSFWLEGTGTFMPEKDARPYKGQKGELNRVSEQRIESLVTKDKLPRVMQAIYRTHPYEEVACDIYPVTNWGMGRGLGRIGDLPQELSAGEFCGQLKKKLSLAGLRLVGGAETMVSRVAVCGGSGGSLIPAAKAAGAQILVTGDIKYHQAQSALAMGLAIADIGHYPSERVIVDELATKLEESLKTAGHSVEVVACRTGKDVFNYL